MRGFSSNRINILVILLLVAGLVVGLYLAQTTQVFRSKASTSDVIIEGPNVKTVNGELVAIPPEAGKPVPVSIKMTTPYEAATSSATPVATSSASPVGSSGPTSSPTANNELQLVVANWGKTVPPGTLGDLDNSGLVDALDYSIAYDRAPNKPTTFLFPSLIKEVNALSIAATPAPKARFYFNGLVQDSSTVSYDVGPGAPWSADPDIPTMCQAAGKAANCSPDIVSNYPSTWDNFGTPVQLIGIGNKLWVRGPVENGQRRYFINGMAVSQDTSTVVGPGATWADTDAQVKQMCIAAGISTDSNASTTCIPSMVVYIPSAWDNIGYESQLIGIGNKVWVRGSIDNGSRVFFINGLPSNGVRDSSKDVGPGAFWFDADPQIREMCQSVGRNDQTSCKPDIVMNTSSPAWDNFGQLLQVIGMSNKVWVRGSVTNGTHPFYIGGSGTTVGTGANWADADSTIKAMCIAAGKSTASNASTTCSPNIVTDIPAGWDGLPEVLLVGINDKLWVRGSMQGGSGGNCAGYVNLCTDAQGRLGTQWCQPGVLNNNQCLSSEKLTSTCYTEQGSSEVNGCKITDQTGEVVNYSFSPAAPAEGQSFQVTINGIQKPAGSYPNVGLIVDGDFAHPRRLTQISTQVAGDFIWDASNPYDGMVDPTSATKFLKSGTHTFQLASDCTYVNNSSVNADVPQTCDPKKGVQFRSASLVIGQKTFGTYKIIEIVGGKTVNEGQPQPMTQQTVVTNYSLTAEVGVHTVTVEFTSPSGQKETKSVNIRVISTTPQMTNLGCSADISNSGILFTAHGENFGTQKGQMIAKVPGKPDTTLNLQGNWDGSLVRGVLANADTSKEYMVTVKLPDGRETNSLTCQVGVNSLQFKANVFCQQIWPFDVSDVDLTFVDREPNGKTVSEKVTIDKTGMVKGIKTKLQNGKNYALAIKSPKSLRKVVDFTYQDGTQSINDMILPVGDIWGANGRPDGVINVSDRGKLNSDWGVLRDTGTVRLADFNQDKRVNSIDWACMRQGYGQSDETIPTPGAQVTYTFSPDPLVASQPIEITFANPSSSTGSYDFVAMVIDGNYKSAEWLGGPGNGLTGPPYIGKIEGGLPAGDHKFQLVGKCKYADATGKTLSKPDCSGADTVRFGEVTERVAPAATNSVGKISLSSDLNSPNKSCQVIVNVDYDAGNATIDGVDAILKYDPSVLTAKSVIPTSDVNIFNNQSGIANVSKNGNLAKSGRLGSVIFTVNPTTTATTTDVSVDFNPNDLIKTTDSNIVERGTILDLLNNVQNLKLNIGSGPVCVAANS